MRTPHVAFAVLAAALLAGCSSRLDQAEDRISGGAFNPGLQSSMTARVEEPDAGLMSPMAALPIDAGQLVTVRGRRYVNGMSQEIVLAGDRLTRGENRIELVLKTEAEGDRYDNLVPLQRFTDADIAAEMEAKFPGVAMSRHDFVLQNGYGPYGIATGRVGALTCAYAWQWIEDLPGGGRRGFSFGLDTTQASVRVRLCRSNLSADQMSRLVAQLVVGRGAAYGAPTMGYGAPRMAEPDALGIASNYGRARGAPRFEGYARAPDIAPQPVVAEARPAVRAAHRRRVVTHRRAAVPARARAERPAAPDQLQPPLYAPTTWQGQPGFTNAPAAPVYGGAPVYAGGPVHASPPQAAPRALDASLPPQAYRGPGRASPNGAYRP